MPANGRWDLIRRLKVNDNSWSCLLNKQISKELYSIINNLFKIFVLYLVTIDTFVNNILLG